MLTRCLGILLAPCLPIAALIFPLGTAHRTSALVCGALATAFSALALSDDRGRLGAAIMGGWAALSALIFPSTFLESTLALSWGVLMFSWLVGPFSVAPQVIRVAAAAPAPAPAETGGDHLPLAA
ncbi:MAG TPA: hypothetical protein VN962_18900 [Polyangia bacterium]|nr:hypothetical protein [Polyangia bacterium]